MMSLCYQHISIVSLSLILAITGCNKNKYPEPTSSQLISLIDNKFPLFLKVDKLQIEMTKEQVKFILGSPVVVDAFDDDTWHYVYRFRSGKDERYNVKKNFVIKFVDNKLVSAEGDFTLSENFNTPMVN